MDLDTRAPAVGTGMFRYVQWSPIVAGALAAAALAFVLHAFASAIGLAVSSTAPTWRDASLLLWILSGIYLVVVAVAAYGLGGYVAGRMRQGLSNATHDETEFRDGIHGLLVWALATLLTAVLALTTAQGLASLASPATTGASASSAGEGLFAYELDRLFRSERAITDIDYRRDEASRVLLTAGSRDGVTAGDRTYLTQLVANRTGISDGEAQQRVQDVIVRVTDSIRRARHTTTLLAFFAGAAAMVGAAAAWFAAVAGGDQRDTMKIPSLRWAHRNEYRASVTRR
jgi:hypothetical protein